MFYIEDYKELIIGQEYLFINVSGDYVGKPFKGSGVYAMLRRLERKTGIKASPHMLRHYFANARRKDGWKLEMISQALGHRNIETTMKYLNITEDELIEVSDAFITGIKQCMVFRICYKKEEAIKCLQFDCCKQNARKRYSIFTGSLCQAEYCRENYGRSREIPYPKRNL